MLEYIKDNLWQVFLILNYAIAIITAGSIVLSNLNPTKTLSYLILLVAFPFVGLIIYFLFGQQYRKSKIFRRKNILNQKNIKEWKEKLKLGYNGLKEFDREKFSDKVKLIRLLYNNEEFLLTLCNKVDILINGEEKFKWLLKDLKNAKKSIHLEYYIIKDDGVGNEVLEILCEKAKEGIKVRLSYDSVGSSLSSKTLKKLKEAEVEFHPFMPVHFPRFTSKLNYRNHRKIIIIDGEIGYVGGVNISDRYVNHTPGIYWRDTHLRIEGEAVGSLQLQFMLNWDFVTPYDVVVENDFFPKCTVSDKVPVQIAASGPDTDWANIMEAIFIAISTADKYIYITTPYFIPSEEILMALIAIAKSGVEVKLIVPKESDSWAAKYATYSYLEKLLEAGVRVYLYKKGFVHAKTMVIDDIFSTVGTANMDYRSFKINFEINALIYHERTAKQMVQTFNNDLEFCDEVSYEQWKNRALIQKMQESFCHLWAPLL
ncbi:cardiolipin synthase [Abyssalbus ytuae]|uniref:Cardiolipin synthase n=1 Tax=Abyssalbus ytuae TaxID=2926907 RepID=A0A9E7D2J5_9FLAO|nr:cardiolipin synthase [Abyssalbus ytuae]UOB18233.1 cardiolipin synthase [Abyssalbus ytuae]